LLGAAADWWAHPSIARWARGNPTTIPEWRRLILDHAEGRSGEADRRRIAYLAARFVEQLIERELFEEAGFWRDIGQLLSGLLPESESFRGQTFIRGMFAFLERSMPSSFLLDVLTEQFGGHLEGARLDPAWLVWQQGKARAIAWRTYDADDFADLPVLADALSDAGCDEPLVFDWCLGKS
jgi:hypothetical protein